MKMYASQDNLNFIKEV